MWLPAMQEHALGGSSFSWHEGLQGQGDRQPVGELEEETVPPVRPSASLEWAQHAGWQDSSGMCDREHSPCLSLDDL